MKFTNQEATPSGYKTTYVKFKPNAMSYGDVQITVTNSPTDNCQLFMMGLAYNLLQLKKDEDFIGIFKHIYTEVVRKKQVLIDIKQNKLEKIQKRFKCLSKSFKIKKYTSTNGSKMVLCFIVLDTTKL
mgnify:CR=1 FL=1